MDLFPEYMKSINQQNKHKRSKAVDAILFIAIIIFAVLIYYVVRKTHG
jgi:hypothetical protein